MSARLCVIQPGSPCSASSYSACAGVSHKQTAVYIHTHTQSTQTNQVLCESTYNTTWQPSQHTNTQPSLLSPSRPLVTVTRCCPVCPLINRSLHMTSSATHAFIDVHKRTHKRTQPIYMCEAMCSFVCCCTVTAVNSIITTRWTLRHKDSCSRRLFQRQDQQAVNEAVFHPVKFKMVSQCTLKVSNVAQ